MLQILQMIIYWLYIYLLFTFNRLYMFCIILYFPNFLGIDLNLQRKHILQKLSNIYNVEFNNKAF